MNTGFRTLSIPFRSIHRLIQSVLPQLRFSFYRHQLLCADFSGGQITSDAGLLPLRSFDQRHRLTSDWAARLSDPRQDDRVRHDSLALSRQRIYQIVAGYEDANDAGRLRHDPLLQILADQKLGHTLGSHPTLSRRSVRLYINSCTISSLGRSSISCEVWRCLLRSAAIDLTAIA